MADRDSVVARYKLSEDKKTLTTPEGELWSLVNLLEGRGQSGFAGFYKDSASEVYLVKKDDPGTCLAEATSTNEFLSVSHQSSVNCAKIGCLGRDLITIQPMVSAKENLKVTGLDKVVYGRKRKPKTLRSEESTHQDQIKEKLSGFTNKAKRDLAASVFVSAALGDESLHLGQFMAIVSDAGEVQGVVRVDFGARERFSRERASSGDFSPMKTSRAYSRSGQWGKDYISYLVSSDVMVRSLYLTLWAKADVDDISHALMKKFEGELNALPEDKQKEALDEFLKQLNKRSKAPLILDAGASIEAQKKQFFSEYQKIVEFRYLSMKESAVAEIQKMLQNLPLNQAKRDVLLSFLTTPVISEKLLTQVHDIQAQLVDIDNELSRMIQARTEWHYVDNDKTPEYQNTSTRVFSLLTASGARPSDDSVMTEDASDEESLSSSSPRSSVDSKRVLDTPKSERRRDSDVTDSSNSPAPQEDSDEEEFSRKPKP